MFYDDHNPPHFHAEYQGENTLFAFNGNILKGVIKFKNSDQTGTRMD